MYPTLFKIGPFVISTIWIFLCLGVYVFIKLLIKSIQKKRGDFKFLYENSTFFILSFIIGARITYVIANLPSYFYEINLQSFFQVFAFWDQGFSFWGGLIFILAAIYWKTRSGKESFKKWVDYLSEPFLYALPIAYIGKFFDGIGYGSKTDLPIGIAFENMDVAIISRVHPTQVYGALLFLLAIFVTKKYFEKKPELTRIPGYKAAFIIAIISTGIFIENLFRGDPTVEIFGIRGILYLSFVITAASLIYLKRLKKQ